jgi:1,4-alpha-glucan branching enzyme
LFAPTSHFGSGMISYILSINATKPDGVILDWVPAHFPRIPWSGALLRYAAYEYEDPRRVAHGLNPHLRLWSDNVRQFLVASALYWLEHFHIDGRRVDAVARCYTGYYSRKDGEWVPMGMVAITIWSDQLAALFQRRGVQALPTSMTIAVESTRIPESTPTFTGGLGLASNGIWVVHDCWST